MSHEIVIKLLLTVLIVIPPGIAGNVDVEAIVVYELGTLAKFRERV